MLDGGGTADKGFIEHFTNYAGICFENFGDRVKYWSTVNEPKLNVYGAYAHAFCPPYISDPDRAMKATVNMLIAHYRTVKILRKLWQDAKVGSVNNVGMCYPVSDDAEDIKAALLHGQMQLLFIEPMLFGKFPELVTESEHGKHITGEMLSEIKAEFVPMDFYEINYYCPVFVQSEKHERERGAYVSELPKDAYGFISCAPALYDLLVFLKKRYEGVPVIITENGYTYKRDVSDFDVSGELHDTKRIGYIKDHIEQCSRALKDGVPLKGYYYWSAFDCWEAGKGYGYPMGLIAVNFDTKERVPRDSFCFYRDLIAAEKKRSNCKIQ